MASDSIRDDAMCDPQEARRNALGEQIMEAFENRGWCWTEDEVVQAIKDIIKKPLNPHCVHMDYRWRLKIRRRILPDTIVRLFGEAQVMPRDSMLAPMVDKVRDELIDAIVQSEGNAYTVILSILQHPIFARETKALASSTTLFPVSYSPKSHRGYRTIRALIRRLAILPRHIIGSTELNTILWILGDAATTTLKLQEEARINKSVNLQTGYTTPQYPEYLRQEIDARKVRAKIRDGMSRLAPEIRGLVFQAMVESTELWSATQRSPSTLSTAPRFLLRHLCDIDFTPEYLDNYPIAPSRERVGFVQLDDLLASYAGEVEEAVVKKLNIGRWIKTEFLGGCATMPLRLDLGVHVNALQKFEVRVAFEDSLIRTTSTPYVVNPVSIYRAQDYLPNVKEMLPGLKELTVTVDCEKMKYIGHMPFVYKSRSEGEDFTTFEAETIKLVELLMAIDVKKKWFRITGTKNAWCHGDKYIEADTTQLIGVADFLQAVRSFDGYHIQINNVEDQLGDFRMDLEAKLARIPPGPYDKYVK